MSEAEHWIFIAAAYGLTVVVFAGLFVRAATRLRRAKKES